MRCVLVGLTDPLGLIDALAARGVATADDALLVIVGCEGGDATGGFVADGRVIVALVTSPTEQQVLRLLDAGCADVIDGASSDALIAARVAALLRDRPAALAVGSLAIDPLARRASRDGRTLDLLPREYALLLHLARHAGQTVARSALRLAVWGSTFDPGTNVLEVHVSRLRAKLDRGFARPMLLTEKGLGYRLVAA